MKLQPASKEHPSAMAARTKRKAQNKPRISPAEKEQVRIRRKIGHQFAIGTDEHARERLTKGTAESHRRYDESNTGIVRLRLYDPLTDMRLTDNQRKAGIHYRACYEAIAQSGVKSASLFTEHVDGGSLHKDIPTSILNAWGELRRVRAKLHPSIVLVMDHVCGLRMSIREASQATGTYPHAVKALLIVGLDVLAGPAIHHKSAGNGPRSSKIA